jgi:hypothetical protein
MNTQRPGLSGFLYGNFSKEPNEGLMYDWLLASHTWIKLSYMAGILLQIQTLSLRTSRTAAPAAGGNPEADRSAEGRERVHVGDCQATAVRHLSAGRTASAGMIIL